MGIRSNNNIKVVKNVIPPTISMSKRDIDKNLTQNFLINLDQLNPADLSRYDVDMVYSEGSLTEKYKMLSSDECDAFNFVYDLAKQNLLPEFNGPIELLNIIYGVLKKNTHGIHVDDATLFSVNPKKLPQILVDMELIKEKRNAYYNTNKGKLFLQAFDKMAEQVPFDWDNFIEPFPNDRISQFFDGMEEDLVLCPIESGEEYILGTVQEDGIDYDDIEENYFNSSLFHNAASSLQLPNQSLKLIQRMQVNEPLRAEATRKLLEKINDSVERSDIEMLPLSSNLFSSTIQGTIGGTPIFAEINNKLLKYCRNVYGNDLKMVLDYSGMTEHMNGNYVSSLVSRLQIIKDDKVVVSTIVFPTVPTPEKGLLTTRTEANGRDYIKRLEYNINAFNMDHLKIVRGN